MYESLNAGRILDLPSKQTLSDGTAGGVEEGSITYDICKEVIDDFVLVREREISLGIKNAIDDDHQLIEGSAGAAIAHMHVRDPETGKGSRNPDYYEEVVKRIREKDSQVIINLTAGMGGDLVIGPDSNPQ